VLAWLEHNSLPVSCLSDPAVIRAALDGLCLRLDGTPAAANTIALYRFKSRNSSRELWFCRADRLGQDRGLCLFASST